MQERINNLVNWIKDRRFIKKYKNIYSNLKTSKRHRIVFVKVTVIHYLLKFISHFLGLIICLILTVIPLPLSHFAQNIMSLNISLNSFKDIAKAVELIAQKVLNVFAMLPSWGAVWQFLKKVLRSVNLHNLIEILHNIPQDLRHITVTLCSYINDRFRQLRIFIRSLFPLKNAWQRLINRIKKHIRTVKYLLRQFFKAVFSVIFVKILFLIIIPIAGLNGAVYLLGIDLSLLIIGILSLICSQLGGIIGEKFSSLMEYTYHRFRYWKQAGLLKKFVMWLSNLLYNIKIGSVIIYIRRKLFYYGGRYRNGLCSLYRDIVKIKNDCKQSNSQENNKS